MSRNVRIENIGAAIESELQYFDTALQKEIQKAVDIESRNLKKEIIRTSPKQSGDYKKGWTITKKYPSAFKYVAVVHNKTRYRLVHLLEHGRENEAIGARPHVFAAQEKSTDRLQTRIDDIIGNW